MDQYDSHSQLNHPQNSEITHTRIKKAKDSFATPLMPTDVTVPTFEECQECVNEQGGLHAWTRETHVQHRPDVSRSSSPSNRPPRISPVAALDRLQGPQNPTANDLVENSNQYDRLPPPPITSTAWLATQGVGPSSTNHNSPSEALPQWSIDQGGQADLDSDDHEASLDQFRESRMMFETGRQALYNRRSIQAHVRNGSRSQSHYTAILAKPSATPFVMPREPATGNTGTPGSRPQSQVPNPSHSQLSQAAVLVKGDSTPDFVQSSAFFQHAHSFSVSGNPSFQNQNIGSVTNIYGGATDGLESLKGSISFDAQFDSSAQDPDRQCHPGTRQNVLKRLRDWVDNPNLTERIFWLYGPAGAGKSAIAQTIARSYDRPKVAATFFFFRSDVNRNDGNRLFTTLAYQLALSMPEIREYIGRSLFERPDLPRADVETQFKQLLARPFHVLSDDATQQLAPVVHIIIDIVKTYQKLAPVIIIDGVDECTDEKLQRQFLKVIGDAVKDDRFPLRFLIVSRSEVHIEQTIRHFQTPIFTIDLANLDDANRDIEKYLVDEFSRIATEQGLDLAWPGQEIIDDIVYKSSGNFIFASLVIRFIGDPYFFAKAQLEIILNIKPLETMSPFAILDQLFLEILRRVPDQNFLKRYLALLMARISVTSDFGELYKDDAVLMHVSEQELHVKLRRMRSLLKFESFIDVHHKSFLDFLRDSSRSGQYYVSEQGGIKGYLEVFVDSLVRYASAVIEQPTPHNAPHFAPEFRTIIKDYPLKIQLLIKEWQEITQPLLYLQNTLLKLPNLVSTWDFLPCDQCTVVNLLRELLHLGLHLGFNPYAVSVGEISTRNLRKRRGVISSITDKMAESTNDKDLDSILLSLFAHLPETLENWSPNKRIINLLSAVLCFDYAETVTRVGFLSDAQKLVDLLDYVIHAKNVLHPDEKHKATLLALKIFARVPIVPLSYFLNGNDKPYHYTLTHKIIHIEILSQTLFANRILDHRYINPMLGINEANDRNISFKTSAGGNDLTMYLWRQGLISSSVTKIQIMFRLAEAIQYLHSMGVVLDYQFRSHNVYFDSDLCPKIRCLCSTSQSLLDKECKKRFLAHDNIFSFGGLCYELYAGADTWPDYPISSRSRVIPQRPSTTPENVWQLIQRCCAKNPKRRPTIDEVVKEIEGWHRVEHVELSLPERTCFGALTSILSDLGRSLCQ